jgi:hypothetical protein
VTLTVGEKEITRKLVVKKDPNSAGTEEDIRAQVKMLRELWDTSNAVAERVNQIETIRKRIYYLKARLKDEESASAIITAGEELDKKLIDVEGNLIQLKYIAGQDFLRWPSRFYSMLGSLAGEVGSTDFPPTAQQIEVHELYKTQWAAYQAQLDEVLNKDLPAFENLLKEHETPLVKAWIPQNDGG